MALPQSNCYWLREVLDARRGNAVTHNPSPAQIEAGALAISNSGWCGNLRPAEMRALAEGVWVVMQAVR